MSEARRQSPAYSMLRSPGRLLLVALAILCSLAVASASLRHTGSLAFPIDDGYIYSNYVLSASQGFFFTYNLGESSGGITGLGWYALSLIAYILVAPFHAMLGAFGPPLFRENAELSRQAGHLYLAAYLAGVTCLAATALGVRRLAELALPPEPVRMAARNAFCWLLGALAAADLGLVWGAMSGLESTLSAALVTWAVVLLISDTRKGNLRWSLLPAALLPWARPDVVAIGAAAALWLLIRAFLPGEPQEGKSRNAFRPLLAYGVALAVGVGLMSLAYYAGWGNPLPSSFYAKVGGIRTGERFFSAAQELLVAGKYLPFVAAAVAVMGALSAWIPWRRRLHREEIGATEQQEHRLVALLLVGCLVSYVAAIMLTLSWFGQEDRYLLPVHSFVIVLAGMFAWHFVRLLPLERLLSNKAAVSTGVVVTMFSLVGMNYIWSTRNYAVEVRNISDAHVAPAKWLADNTQPASVIASEPIGAVKLFSGRSTVDLVGLTTPATLGTYQDWPKAWQKLREAGANYLLFYPSWFYGGRPPAWAIEDVRFNIPDNKIAGDDMIAIYLLDWSLYKAP